MEIQEIKTIFDVDKIVGNLSAFKSARHDLFNWKFKFEELLKICDLPDSLKLQNSDYESYYIT